MLTGRSKDRKVVVLYRNNQIMIKTWPNGANISSVLIEIEKLLY